MTTHNEKSWYKSVPIKDSSLKEFSNSEHHKTTINIKQMLGMLLGLLHYICAGILSGYASVLTTQLEETGNIKINKNEASWITSIVVIPMAPSCLLAGVLLNKISKKRLLVIITLVEIAAWIVIYASTSLTSIFVGRILSGIPSAMGSPIIPPFLGEISHPNMRGLYLCMVLLGISMGMLIIHALGAFFTWNTCALITAFILIAYLALLLCLRETYVWYLRNDDKEQAKRAFHWYRGHNADAQIEIDRLLINRYQEEISGKQSMKEMLKLCSSKLLWIPLTITAVAMVTMHLSGNKAIMFYSITIVSNVIPSLDRYASTIIVDALRIAMTLVGCVLIARVRIRPLFMVSGIGSAVSHFCFAGFHYYATQTGDRTCSILALVALLSYIVFSSIGIAPLPWVIAGEIFPMSVKGVGSGLCCFVYFLTFFVVVKITPDVFDAFGLAGGFMWFGGFTILGTITIYFILPETKNKTLQDIEDFFR